jgi:predicted transcriptional regulator
MQAGTTEIINSQSSPNGLDLSNENLIMFSFGSLHFKILGFISTKQFETLPATVKVCLQPHLHDEYTYVLRLNLYDNDRINTFCRSAAFSLKVNEAEIKKGLCSLREKLEKHRLDEVKHKADQRAEAPLSKKEIDQAREILKADNLLECIQGLLKQAGIVTEQENALRVFLILLSRHFEKPLHVLLQGSTQLSRLLLDTLTSTIPVNQLHVQTSMSASSMYYTRDKDYWKNKILCMSSIEKSFKCAGTIKEFIENNFLKRQTTEADYITRQLYASDKIVPGPICLLGYSDDETLNSRFFQECFFIHLTENEQNRAELLSRLKMDSAGLTDAQEQEQAKRLLREIQRQIRPKKVIIPYAMELQIPEMVFQPLRSMSQLLTFIKVVALLHQHQLKSKKDFTGVEYIEATPEHLEIAISLFKSILITQSDLLSLHQRSFFEKIKMHLKEPDKTFKVSELIQELRISKSVFYREFNSLVEIGYIIRSGGNKKAGLIYKLAHWNDIVSIQNGIDILDEQLKRIKELRFPQVSQKIPSKTKSNKTKTEQEIRVEQN